ncbi:methyltransferase domain-containing protein [Halobacteriovorax marinus]|uniref:methyltransferase domain-containing protein n=1 Tax=Halobacteriovorax marinus TaxID=97084 RepID=UPI003A93CDD3
MRKSEISLKIKKFNLKLEQIDSPKEFNNYCDDFFNYHYQELEESLTLESSDENLYLTERLREEALNTSWYDYYQIIKFTKGKRVIDIGSAYSKGTLLAQCLGEESFHSIEFVEERIKWAVDTAQALGLDTTQFIIGDALDFDYQSYDYFFIYQPTGFFLSKLLNELTQYTHARIISIESHGDLITRFKYDNRLSGPQVILELDASRHDQGLYEFQILKSELRRELILEYQLYNSTYLQVDAYNSVYSNFSYILNLKNVLIDYIEGHPSIVLNGIRINIEREFENLKVRSSLTDFEKDYIDKDHLVYEQKSQRILKVITAPEEALELSSSGRVERRNLNLPSS